MLVAVVILIASHFRVHAQEPPDSSAKLITRFPFTVLSGGVMVVRATLDSFPDSLNFILDTGSGGISLDSGVVDHYNLPVTPTDRMLRGIGSMRKISYVVNRTLRLPGVDVEHLDFHINDYNLLTSVYGVRVDGIIGFSYLRRYLVKINYDNNTIGVYAPGAVRYPKRGMLLNSTITGIPVFTATVADGQTSTSRFYFDTGAGLCLLMSQAFERDSAIFVPGKKVILTQAEGIGGKTPMRLSTVNRIRIGRYKFRKVPAHVFDDDFNVTSYPTLGGLIGNDLLRRFNLVLNYAKNEIHMSPNKHFRDAFDYSYTGLGIYLVDDKIVVEDVLKGSPGEKAGLQPGDVIIAVNNNINGNIQTYKNMLMEVGAKLKILILRDNVPLDLKLKVKSFR